jgi:hypothetical protein
MHWIESHSFEIQDSVQMNTSAGRIEENVAGRPVSMNQLSWQFLEFPQAGKKPITRSHQQFLLPRVLGKRDEIRGVRPCDAFSGI